MSVWGLLKYWPLFDLIFFLFLPFASMLQITTTIVTNKIPKITINQSLWKIVTRRNAKSSSKDILSVWWMWQSNPNVFAISSKAENQRNFTWHKTSVNKNENNNHFHTSISKTRIVIYESSFRCRLKRKHVKPISISRRTNNVWCKDITSSTFGMILFHVKFTFYNLFNLYWF